MPSGKTMNMSQLNSALDDKQMDELTQKLQQDPQFAKLQEQLQKAKAEGNKNDMDNYMKAMEGLFQNENFMNMATQIGHQMMQDNPDMQRYSQMMSDPTTRSQVEQKMKKLRKDPQLAHVFKEVEKDGPMAMLKYSEDPKVIERFNEEFKDITASPAGGTDEEDDEEDEDEELQQHPFIAASAGGDIKKLDEILKHNKKEDINQTDSQKRTALHFASGHGHKDVVEYLLKHKADADAEDSNKSTPMHYAAGYGHLDIVKLLHKKASQKVKNAEGQTPYDVAVLNKEKDVASYLKWH